MDLILDIVTFISALFIVLLGLGFLTIVSFYVIDRLQTQHSLRRNFPVLARFRYLFEKLGGFFRQYFYPSTGPIAAGFIELPRARKPQLPLVLPETCVPQAPCCL